MVAATAASYSARRAGEVLALLEATTDQVSMTKKCVRDSPKTDIVLGNNHNASGAGGFDAIGSGTATGHIPSGSKATFSNTDIGSGSSRKVEIIIII